MRADDGRSALVAQKSLHVGDRRAAGSHSFLLQLRCAWNYTSKVSFFTCPLSSLGSRLWYYVVFSSLKAK